MKTDEIICRCKEADNFRKLQRILARQIRWYKKNETNEGLLYDESWQQFRELVRGECQDILAILANDQ